jgi:hypothetical protein
MSEMAQFPDASGQVLKAFDLMLKRLEDAEVRGLRVDAAEGRRMGEQIEPFETRFAAFLADTAGIAKQRDAAQALILKFAELREKLKRGGESGN